MLTNKSKKKQQGGLETSSAKDADHGNLKTGAVTGQPVITHKPSAFYKKDKIAVSMYTGEGDGHSKTHPNGSITLPYKKTWRNQAIAPGVSLQGTPKLQALDLVKNTSPVSPSFTKRSFNEEDRPQPFSLYGHLSTATVFTCNFCGKNFSKAESLETHKKCHKADKVITIDANVIKKGKIVINGIDIDISPIIRLRKLSSSETIDSEVNSECVRDSPPGGFVFTHKKYGPIKTYGNHPGARGFRDISSTSLDKKLFGDSEKVSPLPGELTLSQLRQGFHAVTVEGQDTPTSARPQNDSHIRIDLAATRAGMKCTYTAKSSNEVNTKAQITEIYSDEAARNESKASKSVQRITSTDRLILYPSPAPIMSTPPIKSNRIGSSENENLNIQTIESLPEKKKGNEKKSSNVDATGKTKGKRGKRVKESETPRKTTKKAVGGKVKQLDGKEIVEKVTTKSTGTTKISKKKQGNIQSKSKEQNVTAEKPKAPRKQKDKAKEGSGKITEDMRQIVNQSNEIDLRDKRKFSAENYEKMKNNAWKYDIMLPSMVPPIGMARYFRHRLENLLTKGKITNS